MVGTFKETNCHLRNYMRKELLPVHFAVPMLLYYLCVHASLALADHKAKLPSFNSDLLLSDFLLFFLRSLW